MSFTRKTGRYGAPLRARSSLTNPFWSLNTPSYRCSQQCVILLKSFKNNKRGIAGALCHQRDINGHLKWSMSPSSSWPRGRAHGVVHVSPEKRNVVIYASQFVRGQKQFAAVSITKVNTSDVLAEPFRVVLNAKKLRCRLIGWLISLYDAAVSWHVYTAFLLSGVFFELPVSLFFLEDTRPRQLSGRG